MKKTAPIVILFSLLLTSCLDTFNNPLCDKDVNVDALIGEYLGELDDNVITKVKIQKENDRYTMSIAIEDSNDDSDESEDALEFSACKAKEGFILNGGQEGTILAKKVGNKLNLTPVIVDVQVLDALGVSYTGGDDEFFGMSSAKAIENTRETNKEIIDSLKFDDEMIFRKI